MKSLNQLTLRGFSPELARILKETARRRGISLNKAAIQLMRRGAGFRDAADGPACIGSALDKYAGTWTAEETQVVEDAVQEADGVMDQAFWE